MSELAYPTDVWTLASLGILGTVLVMALLVRSF